MLTSGLVAAVGDVGALPDELALVALEAVLDALPAGPSAASWEQATIKARAKAWDEKTREGCMGCEAGSRFA